MDKKDLAHQADMLDFTTNAMFSMHFLFHITEVIFDPRRRQIGVGDFYDQWLAVSKAGEPKIPFSPGIIMGYLYCGLVLPKEHWSSLIPKEEVSDLDEDWGLTGVTWTAPLMQKMPLDQFVRRLRNALAHGNVRWDVNGTTPQDLWAKTKIRFHDVGRNPKDTFDTELTIDAVTTLIKKFHSLIYPHVRSQLPKS